MIAFNKPDRPIEKRLALVSAAMSDEPVDVSAMPAELRALVGRLSDHFCFSDAELVLLWQYAAAVSRVEKSPLCKEHLLEAAQLVLIQD